MFGYIMSSIFEEIAKNDTTNLVKRTIIDSACMFNTMYFNTVSLDGYKHLLWGMTHVMHALTLNMIRKRMILYNATIQYI